MIRRFVRRHSEGVNLTVFIVVGTIGAVLVAAYATALAVTPWMS